MPNDLYSLHEQAFFEQLRRETDMAYARSRIVEKDAHYAICATPLRRGAGIVCGTHWPAEAPCAAQTAAPEATELDARLVDVLDPLLGQFLGTALDAVNYTSLNFFRASNLDALHEEDWTVSVPLFVKYTLYLDPPWIVFLGTDLAKRLVGFGLVDDYHTHIVRTGETRHESYSGVLRTGPPFVCVPHPQSLLPPDTLLALWREACATL